MNGSVSCITKSTEDQLFVVFFQPLYIGLPQSQTDAINRSLEAQQQETSDDMKLIFNDAKEFARSVIIDRQISDYNHKRTLGK